MNYGPGVSLNSAVSPIGETCLKSEIEDSDWVDPYPNGRFSLTVEGLEAAMQFLSDTNNLHLIDKELSTDGFTVIALANCVYDEQRRYNDNRRGVL